MTQSAQINQGGAQTFDLAPLTWVLPDLRKSLPLAVNAVRQFFLDTKDRSDQQVVSPQSGNLQDARRLFHQARSALEMIGLNVAAKLLIACCDVVKAFSENSHSCSNEAVLALEKAQLAILDYLDALLRGRHSAALGLFPQYCALLQDLQGQRIHPADLWGQDWTWQGIEVSIGLVPIEQTPRLKAQLGQALLKLMNTAESSSAAELKAACAGLAAIPGDAQSRSFWLLAAGFFEACQYRLIELDVYAKRTASQILQLLNAALGSDTTVSETVAQQATFFCLIAKVEEPHNAAFLTAIHHAYGALDKPHRHYKLPQYGRFDPVQVDFLRRRLTALSESWSVLAGGDLSRSGLVLDHFGAVGETLQKLHPDSVALVHALRQVVDATIKPGAKPNPPLAMEVATTLLYLEALYDDMDPTADAEGERMGVLASRLAQVSAGEPAPAVEPWMEALYRRLSARQSMGSVTSELRIALTAVEAALEKYLRDPMDSSNLTIVSGHLSQMYGVFSVLGLQQASNAVFKIREILDSHLSTERRRRPIPLPVYEQIARSISTMGFLIDMLNYQIAIAKEMFVYDADAGEFSYLNGRRAPDKKLTLPIAGTARPPLGAAKPVLPRAVAIPQTPTPNQPQSPLPNPAGSMHENDDDGAEILDIFLDEAASVVDDAKRALPSLDSDPEAFDDLLLIRRAFHTLKGGARMVGLDAFGEAAWAFEQLMNQWMAESKPPTTELLDLVSQALSAFASWSQAVKNAQHTQWKEAQFRACADAMRLEGRLLALVPPESRDAPTLSSPLPPGVKAESLSNWIAAEMDSNEKPILSLPLSDQTSENADGAQTRVATSPMPQSDQVDTENSTFDGVDFKLFNDLITPAPMDAPLTPRASASEFPEAFFSVFISETSDWAHRLLGHTKAWSTDVDTTSLRVAQDLAHSIRGNSAAVGVQAIAELAQAMEQVLDYLQARKQEFALHVNLLQEAASVLLTMVQSCAEHRVIASDSTLVSRLIAIQAGAVVTLSVESELFEDSLQAPGDALDTLDEFASQPPATCAPASEMESVRVEVSDFAAQVSPVLQQDGSDDPLDSQDQLDADLLPVFQEEGAELIPALGTALRHWVEQPGEGSHRANILRLLHTLKGSGRLTGAFRLGELAHRMESGIEHLPTQGLQPEQIEPFLLRFDKLQGIFESLGRGDAAGQGNRQLGLLKEGLPPPHLSLQDIATTNAPSPRPLPAVLTGLIRVRTSVVERLVDEAGEVAVYRSRTENHLARMGHALGDLNQTLDRLSLQLRELELQADLRIQSRNTAVSDAPEQFDPLEFDRFTRLQEIARMMAEAVGDVSTVRRNVQTALSASQQDLEQQSRQLRELQRGLLRMRLVDFEVIADRLYSVVRQAAKELGKQVTLDLQGGKIELDRSVLERMTPSFEHLLRNAVVHGIEETHERSFVGKPSAGAIKIVVTQEGNDVAIEVSDDGRGLSLEGIRLKARKMGLLAPGQEPDQEAMTKLLFTPGFSTAAQVTELAGRGIGLDVVLSEVNALGGRIETRSEQGLGTQFKLVLPLTTAVTQVLIFRTGAVRFGIPAGLVDTVVRASLKTLESAYADGLLRTEQGQNIQFYGSGPLLQVKQEATDAKAKSLPVLMLRSAGQSLAMHVDEVLGNREVVVKNMGPQLSHLPGLAGITVLPSGETILIYNPIALAKVYGDGVRKAQSTVPPPGTSESAQDAAQAPLILVVDDALTVRRVIQRLLVREGYRVALANDGVQALQVLEQQRPLMVLSDIEMPRMDGFELARSIRARPEIAHLPIVMITSRIAQKHREHAMSLGVNHYLGKPYSEQELLGLIREQVLASSGAMFSASDLNV